MHANIPRAFLVAARIVALTFVTLFVPRVYAQAVDLSSLTQLSNTQVAAVATYKSYNRLTKETVYGLSFKNTSGAALHGPVYVTVEGLSPAGLTVKNATGVSSSGVPYYLVSAADVPAGASSARDVVFGNPSNVRFTFNNVGYATKQAQAPPLVVQITRPATLITVGSTPLALDGTVSDPAATVTVNGAAVSVSGGTFHTNVALTEGHNSIVARAVNANGDEATATISVSLDLTPPYVTIESPTEGAVLTSAVVNVSGLVNDIVRGTVSEGQANVTVNGRAAAVANRSYLAQNVALQEGPNTIQVDAADQVGNVGHALVHVTYQVPTTQFIELSGGQSQEAQIREVVGQSLQVKLKTSAGQVVTNKPVVFRVTQGDGAVGVGGSDEGAAVLVNTDSNGLAATRFRLGSRAGVGNNRVSAKAVGFEGEVVFVASADPKPGNKVSVNSGNNQRGAAKEPLPLPFVVVVTDDGANVIAGSQIEFKVLAGGGQFQNGQTSIIATTDSDGRASANLTLGDQLGLDVQRVTATLVGTQLYAGFTASALQVGAPGSTSISGVVLDNQDHPLPKVTMRVEGTTREAQTDDQGRFKITEVPVGPVHLIADGSTTTVPGEWPTLPYNIVTVPGADNPLPAPVYMVKLDTFNAVEVGLEDKEITVPELPGFKLTVKAGSITFPNGDRHGLLSVTPVNASKIPMAPPNGMQPQLIVTIQPTGARFDPPAPLQLPNVDGHAPGAQVEMYSFDHDLEEFVSIGLGTVSADGTVIASNPGVGVIKAGWHCGSQPTGGGCAANCGECQKCDGNCNCVADNSQTPTSIANSAGDCKKPICQNGAPTQTTDSSDFDSQCATGCDANGNPQSKPDGTACDDNQFCTDPDKCGGGSCSGTKIQDKDLGTVEFSLNLNPILEGIKAFGSAMGVLKEVEVSFKESGNEKSVCCEEKKQKDVAVKKLEYSLNADLETDKIFVPGLSFDIHAVKIGVFVKLGVGGSVSLTGENDLCTDKQCWGGGVGVSGGAEAGVAAQDAAKVVSLSGSLSSELKVEATVDCKKIEYGLSHDGLKGALSVELFDGFVSLSYQVELVPPGPIAQGEIPLDI